MPSRKGGRPTLSASKRDQPEGGIVVDDHLDRQLVMHGGHEFAHQHVEAAVAAERDHLARAIQRLHAVGLTERRPHGRIVEGADDPLRSALPDPVGGPQRVEAGVEDEDRIGLGEIADRPRHRLRMDAILAAREVGLLVQHLIPFPTLLGHLVPEAGVALGRDPIEQQLQGRPRGADNAEHRRRAPAEHLRPLVDLDDVAFAGRKFE